MVRTAYKGAVRGTLERAVGNACVQLRTRGGELVTVPVTALDPRPKKRRKGPKVVAAVTVPKTPAPKVKAAKVVTPRVERLLITERTLTDAERFTLPSIGAATGSK